MKKTIVITGGASGIGAATVSRLLAKDCDVIVLDLTPPDRSDISSIACDLSDPRQIDEALSQLPAEFDALINVAGVSNAAPADITMKVNFLGLRYLVESALPRIKRGGAVVNVASTAGYDWRTRQRDIIPLLKTESFDAGFDWYENHASLWQDNPYKFSKQCAAAYTYRAAGLGLKQDVRVNCVNPGSTGTALTADFRDLVGDALYDWGVAQVGREGRPDDIAEVIEFLAIGECGWLNGVELTVDGGYIAGLIGGWVDVRKAPKAGN